MQQLTDSLLEGIKKTPGRFAAPFIVQLSGGLGYQFPLKSPTGPALLMRNKDKSFFTLFPETGALRARLAGRKSIFLCVRVVFPVLVLGEEVQGWDDHPWRSSTCPFPS